MLASQVGKLHRVKAARVPHPSPFAGSPPKKLLAREPPGDRKALIFGIGATGGGGSIVAEMPDAGNLHLADRLRGQNRPEQRPNP